MGASKAVKRTAMSAFLKAFCRAFGKGCGLGSAGMKFCLLALWLVCGASGAQGQTQSPGDWQEFSPGVAYKNERITEKPWSIHVARIDRSKGDIEMRSVHARGKALGLATLSAMVHYAREQMG